MRKCQRKISYIEQCMIPIVELIKTIEQLKKESKKFLIQCMYTTETLKSNTTNWKKNYNIVNFWRGYLAYNKNHIYSAYN